MQPEPDHGAFVLNGNLVALQLKFYTRRELVELDCSGVVDHFVALPKSDRLSRFMRRMEVGDLQAYAAQLASKAHAVGLAVHGGRTLAVAELHALSGNRSAELAFGVDVSARRHGIGSALVKRLIDEARSSAMTEIRAVTLFENSVARHLLMKCGFSLRCEGDECEAVLRL